MIPFGEEQLQAINAIKEFISSSEIAFTLIGSAGTGKTSIMMEIVTYLEKQRKRFALSAPTHQAKMVLETLSGHEAFTIHKLLQLSPDLEILHLDLRDLNFYSKRKDKTSEFPNNGVIICDEASMINDNLYDLLINRCIEYNSKILFVGDEKQLAPVNSDYVSKVFNLNNHFELTRIYRQDEESGLTDYLITLREHSISKFDNSLGIAGSLLVHEDPKDFLREYLKLLREDLGTVNAKNKLMAYTNKRVNTYNTIIRNNLFGSDDEFFVGEILRGCDNIKYGFSEFYNSLDYIIQEVNETDIYIPGFIKLPGYSLKLYDTVYKTTKEIDLISTQKVSQSYLSSLASYVENTRLTAIEAKEMRSRNSGYYWQKYYQLVESFAIKSNLFVENRVVKKQTFDNGYAITVHKS